MELSRRFNRTFRVRFSHGIAVERCSLSFCASFVPPWCSTEAVNLSRLLLSPWHICLKGEMECGARLAVEGRPPSRVQSG